MEGGSKLFCTVYSLIGGSWNKVLVQQTATVRPRRLALWKQEVTDDDDEILMQLPHPMAVPFIDKHKKGGCA